LCRVFKLSFNGSETPPSPPSRGELSTLNWPSGPEWYKRHNFFKKPCVPVIPAVFQGLDCSKGPRNISYNRRLSAPYSSQILSGLTTLYLDLDIFSTSRVTLKPSSSDAKKVASAKSSLQFLNASKSNSSEEFTKETSECTLKS